MLAKLGDLDPSDDRDRPDARRERLPRLGGSAESAETPKEPGPLDENPFVRPGRVLSGWRRG